MSSGEHAGPVDGRLASRMSTAIEPLDQAWWILVGAGLCAFCGVPGVLQFTFGTFTSEIVASTGWPPVVIAAAIGPGMLPAAFLAPVVGIAADRLGTRRLALFGGPAMAAGLIGLGLLPRTPAQFVEFLALATGLAFAATPVLYARLVTGWFVRRRGTALSVMFGCGSLGIATWSPLAAKLMQYGWRFAYAGLGIASGSIIFASALFLLRDPPRRPALTGEPEASGASLREALSSPLFWRLTATFMLLSGDLGGVAMNMPVILRHAGLDAQHAATAIAFVGASMFVGMSSVGIMLDRWYPPYVTGACLTLPLAGLALLLTNHSTSSYFAAAALIGFGLGSELNAASFLVSQAFGTRSFGAIYGAMTAGFAVSSAIGPALVGAALADAVPPATVFLAALCLLTVAMGYLLTLRSKHLPYVYDRELADTAKV